MNKFYQSSLEILRISNEVSSVINSKGGASLDLRFFCMVGINFLTALLHSKMETSVSLEGPLSNFASVILFESAVSVSEIIFSIKL